MTACIHHGPPGSFKSFAVLQFEAINALKAGRTVVTNLRGFDSIERIEDALDIEIPDEAELISVPHNNEGFDLISRFFHWAPKGALIFIDEGQRAFPKRTRDLGVYDYQGGQDQAEIDGRPATLEDAFDQHRHHNWDIYITTPNIGKVHPEIRQVCEYGYRHRNLTGLLPWYKNKWKEVQHDPSNSGQSASHSIGQPILKQADTKYFDCYQSTQTGTATNDIKTPSILKQPKIIMFACVFAFAVSYQVWFWFIKDSGEDITEPAQVSLSSNVSNPSEIARPVSNGGDGIVTRPVITRSTSAANYVNHPVMTYRGQFLGTLDNRYKRNYFFRFYDEEGRFFQISSKELKQLGFKVKAVGCVAQIEYEGRYRFIPCYDQLPPEMVAEASQRLPDTPPLRIEWLESQEVHNQF